MMAGGVVRKLVVEVADARDLLPKDGQGTSSPYVVVDFAGQRKRTKTCERNLNPSWHEKLEFIVTDPASMDSDELDVEIYNDKRFGGPAGSGRRNHFLGRVRICGTQFAKQGEGGLIYFPLEKRSVLSWVRGEIGLKIYYYDEPVEEKRQEPPAQEQPPEGEGSQPPQGDSRDHPEAPKPTETAIETQIPATPVCVVVMEDPPPPVARVQLETPTTGVPMPDHPLPEHYAPEVRKIQTTSSTGERITRLAYSPVGIPGEKQQYAPRVIPNPKRTMSSPETMERVPPPASAYDLVEPMHYLFVRVVKARGLRSRESPYIKIRSGAHDFRTRDPPREVNGNPEWNKVFALSMVRPESTLEISTWDGDGFLGGVCFDLSDVPVRDQPDGPLAPQWYRLEGGDEKSPVTGDIMVAVWFGTQADEAFAESISSDQAPHVSHTRPKVYQSPKLWYLRATVIEAQDLRFPTPPPGTTVDVRVKIELNFQSMRTRRAVVCVSSTTLTWLEDLMFVVSEPLDDHLIILVEDRTVKDIPPLGHVSVPVGNLEQRLDERQIVPSRWFNLDAGGGGGNGNPPSYCGRIHLRLCLEGGYHVLDEAAHVCSDFQATAKQLWKPAIGVLELGIIGARGLLPMKTKGGAKGSTDAYCVAKYGKKWVRTRTITDTFDPRWNEQYTWQVYDPCTVLTIGVFDNWRMFTDADDRPDYRIGKVRIRISTLESNKVYTNSYPLLVLLRTGLKKMGEVQLAVRFVCPGLLPDTCALYAQAILPRMHYLRPIGVAQQEVLRIAAIKMVATWLARSEPSLGPEVVRYMLDADAHTWSMRRSKANWFRLMSVLAWAVGLARWVNDIRRWRSPTTTVLVHILYLVLVWYPELVVPTGSLYLFLIGVWYHRFRPRVPAGMDARLSQAEGADPYDLDEEFDPVPSSKPAELVRARYDRLRTIAARVQTVMGDLAAQGERVQALVSWRDPRATRLFIGICLAVALVLYIVPPKMVAVALGFYFLRHPMFRDPMPPASLNFFRRLPSLSDRLL